MLNIIRPAATLVAVCAFASSALAAPFKSAQGYQITPPQGFSKAGNMMGTDSIFMKPSGENLNMVVRQVPRNATLALAASEAKRGMGIFLTGYRVVEQGRATLGGVPATVLGGTFRMGTPARTMRNRQLIALRNGKAYILTFTAPNATYARHKAAFDKAAASVKWTK